MPVLCLPLLAQCCRKPWPTHPERIVFMPNALQTCTPSGAPQPAAAARQPSRNAPTSLAASIIEQDLTEFWDSQGEEGESYQAELQHLRMLLFRKAKLPVPEDLWNPGAAKPYVETFVREKCVLQKLKDVIQHRQDWLAQQGLPMDTQMRDQLERTHFLQWSKDQFHSEPLQLALQKQDAAEFARHKNRTHELQGRKNSRWNGELQRRLGSAPLWLVVSFTGRFDVHLLRQVCRDGST